MTREQQFLSFTAGLLKPNSLNHPCEVHYYIGRASAKAWCSCGAWSTYGSNELEVVEAGECHERSSNSSEDDE